jgi:hypothetical protein
MIPFDKYAQVKDNYCVGYFGPELSYVLEIARAIPALEEAFPGVRIHLSCRDEFAPKVGVRAVPVSHLKARKGEFAYIRDLRHDGKMTPARILLHECGISTHKTTT